jgi:hypothetical protein
MYDVTTHLIKKSFKLSKFVSFYYIIGLLKLRFSKIYWQNWPIFLSGVIYSITEISYGTSSYVNIFLSTILV